MGDLPPMSRDQVRRVDAWAIGALGVAGAVLMENAGSRGADVACEMLHAVPSPRAAVLAGAGNNAGDGFVIARHLLVRHISVDVYLLAPAERIRGDSRVNFDILVALGMLPVDWTDTTVPTMTGVLGHYDLLIDALGGTGIDGPLRGTLAAAVEAANGADVPILAVDIPTGLNCDTGEAQGPTIRAARTVTFVAPKLGFAAAGAERYTGEVIVVDIGVPAERAQ